MIYLSTWLEKIKGDLKVDMPKVKTVGFARDLPNLRSGRPKALPAVFVLPLSESARPIDSTQTTGDYITQSIEVVYIANDDDKSEQLTQIREAVQKSLLGWSPDTSVYPCHFKSGARTGYKDGMISWSDVFVLEFVRTL